MIIGASRRLLWLVEHDVLIKLDVSFFEIDFRRSHICAVAIVVYNELWANAENAVVAFDVKVASFVAREAKLSLTESYELKQHLQRRRKDARDFIFPQPAAIDESQLKFMRDSWAILCSTRLHDFRLPKLAVTNDAAARSRPASSVLRAVFDLEVVLDAVDANYHNERSKQNVGAHCEKADFCKKRLYKRQNTKVLNLFADCVDNQTLSHRYKTK